MATPQTRPALRVSNLRKTFKDVVAVDGIDLDVRAGECFGLLGPNGAGKDHDDRDLRRPDGAPTPVTSKCSACAGIQTPGHLRQRLGIQLQETQLSEKLTVAETLRLFRSFFHEGPSPDEVIALVQLEEKRDARVGALSGGQKQRLALACALVGRSQTCCFSTSRRPGSTRRRGDSCGT